MNGSQKVDVICQNMSQNSLKWPPEDGNIILKKALVAIRVISRPPEQNCMTKYWTDIKKNKYICQNRPPKFSKMAPSRSGALDHQLLTTNIIPILYNCTKFHEKILNDSQEIK